MTDPASPAGWTAGRARPAKPLRDPTVRHTIKNGVIRRLPPIPDRWVPPDCDLTYGDEEPEVPLPVAETSREARRALMAVYALGAAIVVGLATRLMGVW